MRAPITACSEAIESPRLSPTRAGGKSASPVMCRRPTAASAIVPNAGWSRIGPVCPYPEIRTTISPGFAAMRASGSRFHASRRPGLKFSIRMSLSSASCRTRAWSSGSCRSAATDTFPRDWMRCHSESPPFQDMPHVRSGSPRSGCSTLMTSAPKSANIRPANGPAINVPSSRTRRSESGPRGPLAAWCPVLLDMSSRLLGPAERGQGRAGAAGGMLPGCSPCNRPALGMASLDGFRSVYHGRSRERSSA